MEGGLPLDSSEIGAFKNQLREVGSWNPIGLQGFGTSKQWFLNGISEASSVYPDKKRGNVPTKGKEMNHLPTVGWFSGDMLVSGGMFWLQALHSTTSHFFQRFFLGTSSFFFGGIIISSVLVANKHMLFWFFQKHMFFCSYCIYSLPKLQRNHTQPHLSQGS